MSPQSVGPKRRLATVLVADAVGFSRRMGENEPAALAAVLQCRAVFADVVRKFRGRLVGTPGDFVLALMESSGDAIEAALEAQALIAERNLGVEPVHRAEYRIGIGLGDVYELEQDVLGDTVNVAARLQTICPPGGVTVSGAVRDVIGTQSRFAFEYVGDQTFKNMPSPIRAYLIARPGGSGDSPGSPIGVLRGTEQPPARPVVDIEQFRPRSGTDEERLFAEGVTEELIAVLAGLSNSVIVRQAGERRERVAGGNQEALRLYRLSGSVHCGVGQVRILARLVAQGNGEAVWADRFSYELDSKFDAQEVIAREVVTAIQVSLTEGDQAQLWRRGTTSVRAWELFQRGHDMERRFTRHGHRQARGLYSSALDIDSSYTSALVALAFCHLDEIRLGWAADVDRSFADAEALYCRAAAINPDEPEVQALLAYVELHRRNYELAVSAMEKAFTAAPRSAELAAYLGYIYETVGRQEDGIAAYEQAVRLSPHYPSWIATNLGFALCLAGRLHEARKVFLGVLAHHPDYSRAHLGLAIAYRRLGLMQDAIDAAKELRRQDPLFSIDAWMRARPYADAKVNVQLADDMRSIGLT